MGTSQVSNLSSSSLLGRHLSMSTNEHWFEFCYPLTYFIWVISLSHCLAYNPANPAPSSSSLRLLSMIPSLFCTEKKHPALYFIALSFLPMHCMYLCYSPMQCILLYCRALHGCALHCTVLTCTGQHYCALKCSARRCTALRCTALHFYGCQDGLCTAH